MELQSRVFRADFSNNYHTICLIPLLKTLQKGMRIWSIRSDYCVRISPEVRTLLQPNKMKG
jgi:hypothetical protein